MKRIVIAVDGFAATGKSTTAGLVAGKLGYTFIDTGAMYRAVTLFMLRAGIEICPDNSVFEAALDEIGIAFLTNPETGKLMVSLNGENVEDEIRGLDVSAKVSEVAAISPVRRRLVALQQEMGRNGNVVMDGRDIGTVVFPNAELKIFLTAQMDIRVERRLAQLAKKGKFPMAEEVRKDLEHRDFIDSNRADSPLKKAVDAIEIDTSFLTIPAQTEIIIEMAKEILNNQVHLPEKH